MRNVSSGLSAISTRLTAKRLMFRRCPVIAVSCGFTLAETSTPPTAGTPQHAFVRVYGCVV